MTTNRSTLTSMWKTGPSSKYIQIIFDYCATGNLWVDLQVICGETVSGFVGRYPSDLWVDLQVIFG